MNRSKSLANKNNSVTDLQFKMELEELKENLLKESLNFNKTYKNSVRNSDHLNPHDTLCNYFKEQEIPKEKKTMHQVLKTMLDLKKSNLFLSREIIDKQKTITEKEKMIIQMYEELNCHLTEHSQLKIDLETIKELKNECENNRDGVKEYCKNLKQKFKHFVEIIDMYEKKIRTLRKSRDQIIKTSEAIIEMKIKDKLQIDQEMDRTNRKIDVNVNMISEMEKKFGEVQKDREDQKNRFLELERIDKIKIAELEKKYMVSIKKCEEYQILDTRKENEIYEAHVKTARESEEKENLEIKLNEVRFKNEFLQKQLEEISMRLTGLSNKSCEEKKSDKILMKHSYRSQVSNRSKI